jgi:hypothetical protein
MLELTAKQRNQTAVRGTLRLYGRGWDDPEDDDLIRKDT